MPTIRQLDSVIAQLAARFPQTFIVYEGRRRPLKVGIDQDLAIIAGDIDWRLLAAALRTYVRNPGYLAAFELGVDRIDLFGDPAGAITEHDVANAKASLAGLQAWRRRQKLSAVDQTLLSLCERFPKAFVMYEARRKPLKLGIETDIVAALGPVPDLDAALRCYTGNAVYLSKLHAGMWRIGLDGEVAGTVTVEEALAAGNTKPGPVEAEPVKPRRLGLADLKEAAAKRKAQAA